MQGLEVSGFRLCFVWLLLVFDRQDEVDHQEYQIRIQAQKCIPQCLQHRALVQHSLMLGLTVAVPFGHQQQL